MSRSYKHTPMTYHSNHAFRKKGNFNNKTTRRYMSMETEFPFEKAFHKKLTHSSHKRLPFWVGPSYQSFLAVIKRIYPPDIKVAKISYRDYRHHFVNK